MSTVKSAAPEFKVEEIELIKAARKTENKSPLMVMYTFEGLGLQLIGFKL